MRSIRFNKYVQTEWEQLEGNTHKTRIVGTGAYQKDFPNEGLFHCWGVAANGEGGTDSIAIIEMRDGTIESPHLKDIKFTS